MRAHSLTFAALLSLTTSHALAQSEGLVPLLSRGPVVLVEEGAQGKFGQATGTVLVDSPPETVWKILIEMERFKDFVPKVNTAEVLRRDGNEFDIRMVIDTPGPDTDHTIRWAVDNSKREMKGTWMKGDLKGSRWMWKVESLPDGRSLLSQQISLKNFSVFLANVDDDQQTITVGLNVSSALAATKAVKKRAEELKRTGNVSGAK
jgi:ribosome-associated toxin RatA of RatAB toxin-antitoxin module